MSVTSVVNQKGGVGKTTVALGLASALASAGRSVLVVDLDPQANATTGLGIWEPGLTIDEVLTVDRPGEAARAVVPAGWVTGSQSHGVSVVPSSPNLAQVEHQLVSDVIGAQDRLSVALDGVADDFDEVIVDCPPSLGLLTVNALFASDRVVVVTEPAAWASDGVEQILRNCERIAARRGGAPVVAGIVVNRVGRTRDANYWADELARAHRDLVVVPFVKLRAAVAEAAAQAVAVHSLTRSGAADAIEEFDALVLRLFSSMQGPMEVEQPVGVTVDLRSDEPADEPADEVAGGVATTSAPSFTGGLSSHSEVGSERASGEVTGDPIGGAALVPGFR